MVFEELNQRDDEPSGLSPAAWAAIAVVAVLAGVLFLVLRAPAGAPVRPAPTPPPPSLDPVRALAIQSVCPLLTDSRNRLTVSFELRNAGIRNVTLVDVVPVLPAGLRVDGPVTAGGSCGLPGVGTPGGLLTPGQTQVVSMRLRRPGRCPQPAPGSIWVKLRVNQMIGTTTVPVLSELGAVNVDTCSGPTPS